eukprot:TRINITY_DN26075_c0_g1_i1.p1 TRINITY_DN26075_c0_g1~~TRINITY_DN26075_c0_g1_i1.p1  ORF type:complete len:503 (+),score=113.20 TRINITY_DN26075_c0_g1_i1:151-1659(+)
MTEIRQRQLFIGGEWIEAAKGKRIPVINPATGRPIGDIPAASAEDVELAVQAARKAFTRDRGRYWARAPGSFRAKYLRAIAAKIIEKKQFLAKLEVLDCGKPFDEAAWDMDDVAACFEYYADLAEALDKKQATPLSLPMDAFKGYVLKEPIGVVGLITPWNYPLLMASWKVAASLAAGCTAILKPSELSSVTCLELAAICKEIGLPSGVLNILTGLGVDAGAPLASHPDVDKIAFTGSTATGRSIMSSAAQFTKPLSLELGGKSPILVFDDADIEKAVEWVMFGCFWTNGQICSATSRLLVQETIARKFIQKLVNWTKSIKVSDPLEEGCRLGPVVSEGQYKKILRMIAKAKEEGASVLCGGRRPEHLSAGYFIEPTVLGDVKTSMEIWREEVFGPVLAVATFRSEEEALDMANDSQYALAGAVISKDTRVCERVSKSLQAGIVWINCSQPCFVQAPWGGNKRSGFGRDLGEWGLENYLTVKQVTEYVSNDAWGWYPKPSKL